MRRVAIVCEASSDACSAAEKGSYKGVDNREEDDGSQLSVTVPRAEKVAGDGRATPKAVGCDAPR